MSTVIKLSGTFRTVSTVPTVSAEKSYFERIRRIRDLLDNNEVVATDLITGLTRDVRTFECVEIGAEGVDELISEGSSTVDGTTYVVRRRLPVVYRSYEVVHEDGRAVGCATYPNRSENCFFHNIAMWSAESGFRSTPVTVKGFTLTPKPTLD